MLLRCLPRSKLRIVASLASRVAEESGDKENYHDPSILSKLPFSEATWSHVLDIFHVHGSAAKLINRARSCVFSRTPLTLNDTSTPMIGKLPYVIQG